MSRPSALALAATLALAGCDDVPPPPGEELGTFAFEAVLEAAGDDDGRCDLSESPETLRFDAVLSYEPVPLSDGTLRLWIQILGQPGTPREGRLSGTQFVVRSPADPGRVPRSLDTCRFDENGDGAPDRTRCTLLFAEFIGGELLSRVPADGCADLANCTDCRFDSLEEGQPLPPVGGVCGDVTEDVVPEPTEQACYCTRADGTVEAASPCTLVYRLVGRPS